jgi:hypothetical protein
MRMPGQATTSGRATPARGVRAAASGGSSLVGALLVVTAAVGFVYLARKELPALKREYRLLRM